MTLAAFVVRSNPSAAAAASALSLARRSIIIGTTSTTSANVSAHINSNAHSNVNTNVNGCGRYSSSSDTRRRMHTITIASSSCIDNNNIITNQIFNQSQRTFKTADGGRPNNSITINNSNIPTTYNPGSKAFADCETNAIQDLFYQFATKNTDTDVGGVDDQGSYLCLKGINELLISIGERPDDATLNRLFLEADLDGDGKLHLEEFLLASDKVLGGAPARIVIVVGGPGSGKGILCSRLSEECGIIHLSSGDLLRDEVENDTLLGRECAEIMKRGGLVSSAVITALIRRRMRKFPGKRVLLDGFPRSVDNAHDFLALMGKPELALHLDCDDTVLMERIMKRSKEGAESGNARADDNFDTAIRRLRTFHKYHKPTMDWLKEQHVPVVNLDCSGTPENVWNQLLAIGRLMRPTARLANVDEKKPSIFDEDDVVPLQG